MEPCGTVDIREGPSSGPTSHSHSFQVAEKSGRPFQTQRQRIRVGAVLLGEGASGWGPSYW